MIDRVRVEQAKYRESAALARKNSWINGLTGWACMIVAFFNLPWHLSTIAWWGAVLFWVLAFFQWTSFIVDRKASRMYPDVDDLRF